MAFGTGGDIVAKGGELDTCVGAVSFLNKDDVPLAFEELSFKDLSAVNVGEVADVDGGDSVISW